MLCACVSKTRCGIVLTRLVKAIELEKGHIELKVMMLVEKEEEKSGTSVEKEGMASTFRFNL